MAKFDGKKYLTTQEAIEQDAKSPLFVLNVADESDVTEYLGADLQLSARADGEIIPIKIPKTWLATELTTMAPREAILRARTFLSAVNSGMVKIVTREYAESLNNSAAADGERARLEGIENRQRAAASNRQVVPPQQKERGGRDAGVSMENIDIDEMPTHFTAWVQRLNEMTQEQVIASLRERRSLTDAEIDYMIENLSNHPRVVAWLRRQLQTTEE